MRVGVLADIHGNLEALLAVSADIEKRGVDRVVCLGDNVGYGPNPEEVVVHLLENNYQSVCGNHEFALFDERGRRWLNFQAAENCLASKQLMSRKSLDYLRTLPANLQLGRGFFVHGFPLESFFLYLNRQKASRIQKLLRNHEPEIYFVGHTHTLEVVAGGKVEINRWQPDEGLLRLDDGCKYIIGSGSVGQPRDGDGRSVYLIWDDETMQVEVIRVPYDFELTRTKIRQRGFPEIYGLRLGQRGDRR